MTISNYLANELLDHALGKQAWTADSTLYAGLATNVDSSGTITGEPGTSQGYARVAVVNDDITTIWDHSTAKAKTTVGAITWPTASTSWGTLTHFFLSDGSTQGSGNLYCYGTLTASIAPVAGVAPAVTAGNLTITWT
jgi:hypothetical protein